jgi:hypothetical protein
MMMRHDKKEGLNPTNKEVSNTSRATAAAVIASIPPASCLNYCK